MSTDKLATLRAHSHRRAASNPFPIVLMDHSSDSGSSGGESDIETNSILQLVSTTNTTSSIGPESTATCTHDAESDEEMSIDTMEDSTESDDTAAGNDATLKRYQSLDIPDLSHSPTLNRYSVSVFDFTSEISEDISSNNTDEFSSQTKSPEMAAAALLNKIHRSFTNLTSVSSIESLDDYRGMVLKEIIETERTYLNSLDTLISVLLPALEGLVAPRDLRLLFPCQLEPLLEIHQSLLMKLEERVEGMSQWHGIVGDIFGRLCSDKEKDFISVYSAYMNEFKVAMQTLVKYQNTSPLFCRIANNCIKKHGQEGLNLSSFLLTPIQRLPRYELLLKQLMKHTPDDHPDTYYLQGAMESLHKDLTALDRSIQACQFALTVSSFKDDNRKRSLKKSNSRSRKRHQSSRFAARIKRHFSQANIDDFTSSSSSSSSRTSPGRRPVSALEKTSTFAVSEFNILDKMDSCDSRPSSSMGTSFATTKAISCSEVHLLDSKQPPPPPPFGRRGVVSFDSSSRDEDGDIDEFVEVDRTPCLSHSSSITSHDSIAMVLNKRGSIYSNNSSNTSGFDSLTGIPVDLDERGGTGCDGGTLRPVIPSALASTSSNDSGFSRDCYRGLNSGSGIIGLEGDKTPTIRTNYPEKTASSASKKRSNSTPGGGKKKATISSALKVIKMATGKEIGSTAPLSRHQKNSSHSKSSNQLNRFSISDPTDFRHVQHGFTNRPLSIAL